MKKILSLTFVTLLSVSAQIASAAQKSFSLPLSLPGKPVSVEINVYRGSVTLIGYQGDSVEISAVTSTYSGEDKNLKKVKEKLNSNKTFRSSDGLKSVEGQSLRLEVKERNNKVEISSEVSSQQVDLVIKVPQRSSVEASVYQGGDIKVDGVNGGLELEAYQGMIVADQVSGPIVAETATTDIVVSFAEFSNKSPSSLTSHMGNVDISLSKKVAVNVNVQTYQGEIFSGLDEDFVAVDEVKKSKKGAKQEIILSSIMRAKINGGGQDLSLISYGGNLYIRKAE